MSFCFHILTYGCKVNQYESQALRESWQALGGIETEIEQADFVLLAGCAVTAEGVADARQMVRKLGRETRSRIIVTGCAASAEPQDFHLPGVVAVVSQTAKWNLLHCSPQDLVRKLENMPAGIKEQPLVDFEEKKKEYPDFSIQRFERTRPVLKIQDGCSHYCSYCIVPLTRGPARSRNPEESMAEVRRLLAEGYREIMISGINLRQYHEQGGNFWSFLRRLNKELAGEWQGRARFRLSSLEPAQLNAEGLEALEECTLLCPHLHLSLQSGSPSVLQRMGREHYSPERMVDAVSALHRFWPVFGLGADILMGFPGESDAETNETLDMVNTLPLTYAHVFPYSSRPGTKAASLPGHLAKKIRQEHAARVRDAVAIKKTTFLQSMLKLPSFALSLDQDGNNNMGWNEYYVSCQLNNAPEGYSLQQVRPLCIENGHVLTDFS